MIALTSEHQRKMHSRTNGAASCLRWSCAPIPVADEAQGSVFRCLTDSPVARLGGIAILPSHRIRTAGGWCINAQRRRIDRSLLPGRSVALQFSARPTGARSQFRLLEHCSCQGADALESHVSQSVGFNTTELMRGKTRNAGIPFQG